MKAFIFFISLLFFLNGSPPIQLKLQEPFRDSLLANKTQFFEVKLDEHNKTSDWNLFFVVEPTANVFWEKTQIEVFTMNEKHEQTFSIDCIQTGIDACFINAKQILQNETIYARVTCFEACDYQINTYWSKAFPINPDKNLLLDFQDVAYAKIFTLNLNNRNFVQFRLILKAQTFLKDTAPIKLYANYGKKAPTLNQYDIKGIHLWDDGQGIFLKKVEMKQLFLTILIEGPAENKLKLEPFLINSYQTQIKFQKPIFDYLNKSMNRTYLVNLVNITNNTQDLYIRLSTFSGSVQLDLYTDKELKNRILMNVFGNMGQIQFQLSKFLRTAFNITDSIYAHVRSGDTQSTYLLSTFTKKNNLIKLIPDVTTYAQIFDSELQSYYIQIIRKQKNNQQIEQIINFQHIGGDQQLIPHFSICHQLTSCAPTAKIYSQNPEKYDTIRPNITKTGQTTHYKIKFKNQNFKQIDQTKLIKSILLITIYKIETKKDNKIGSKYALTFIQNGKIKNLRQNKPQRDRLTIGQVKYYKFVNINKDVKQIRIHLNQIAGATDFEVFRKDPRNNQGIPTSFVSTNNRIDILTQLLDPIYISVIGKQHSFFSLTIQLIRDTTITPSIYQKDSFNYLILARDQQYKFSLGTQEYEVVQIPPITDNNFYEILLEYTDKAQICASYGKFPQHPNCEFMIESKSYKVTNVVTSLYLGIKNKNPKNIIVKIKYTSLYGCEQKKMGQIWNKFLQLPISYCANYAVTKYQDIEIILSLSNQKYTSLISTLKINDKEFYINSAYLLVNKQHVQSICNISGHCNIYISIFNKQKTTVQLLAQYINGDISLLDGIAQPIHGIYTTDIYKNFKFEVPNYQNITIAVQSKIGFFQFYVKVYDTFHFKFDWIDKYPKKQDFHYKSSNAYYTQYNFFILNEQMMKKYCEALPCIILISVTSSNAGSANQYGSYIIEATQQNRFLKEHTPAIGFLQQNSLAFYNYYYSQQNGTLLVSLTTENKQCANFYLSKGDSKRASNVNFVKKNIGNEIIYAATKGMYSITVQAYQNCRYSISASSKNFKIYEIINGQYKDINLQANQGAYFFYYHYHNQSFKILSLEEYGQVLISGNVTQLTTLEQISNDNQIQSKKFTWSLNKNFLRINKSDKYFQPFSFYIFYLKALTKTSTSLILNIEGNDVPLSNKKRITDSLTTLEQIRYTVHTYQKFLNLTIFVHYGEIQVTLLQNDKNISKKFKKSSSSQFWYVDLPTTVNTYQTKLTIKAIQSALYQLTTITNKQQKTTQRLRSGLPTYLFLVKETPKCVAGSIQSKDHKFIISVGKQSIKQLKTLRITGKIGKKIIQKFEKQIIDNTMSLSFDLNSFFIFDSQDYMLCFETNAYLSLTILPVGSISLLPEATSMVVYDSKNFTFSSQGKLIIQVYECVDNTKILLSKDFNKIGGSQSQLLHWKKLGQNYLVQFETFGLVYLSVQGTKSIIRWKHVEQEKGEGIGYYLFKIPNYKHTYTNKQLKFFIQPLDQVQTNPKLKVVGINYTLVVTNSEKMLKQISQCNIGMTLHKTFLQFNPQSRSINNHQFTFNFDEINRYFDNNKTLFTIVIAQVEIQVIATKKIEDYKFIYEKEEINWEALKALDQKSERPNQRWWKLMEFLVVGIVISIFTICCIREIIKVTLKYRNKNLLETQAATENDQPHAQFKQQET